MFFRDRPGEIRASEHARRRQPVAFESDFASDRFDLSCVLSSIERLSEVSTRGV